jgi:hypothetical protein
MKTVARAEVKQRLGEGAEEVKLCGQLDIIQVCGEKDFSSEDYRPTRNGHDHIVPNI